MTPNKTLSQRLRESSKSMRWLARDTACLEPDLMRKWATQAEEAAAKLEALAALRPRLAKDEWQRDVLTGDPHLWCPVCGNDSLAGHLETCWLPKVLALLPEEGR